MRDDRPFGGSDPPAAMFFYSRDRGGEHPRRHLSGWVGTLQADAYAGFNDLYDAKRRPGLRIPGEVARESAMMSPTIPI